MKTKSELLKDILKAEAMQAQWGVKAAKLSKEYVEKYTPYPLGTKVKVYYKRDKSFSHYGIITQIKFNGHGWMFCVTPTKKDFRLSVRHKYSDYIDDNSIYKFEQI